MRCLALNTVFSKLEWKTFLALSLTLKKIWVFFKQVLNEWCHTVVVQALHTCHLGPTSAPGVAISKKKKKKSGAQDTSMSQAPFILVLMVGVCVIIF